MTRVGSSGGGDIRDVLASADADGDGQLSPEEQAALIARLRGAVVVQEKSPEEAEAEEAAVKRQVVNAVDRALNERLERRFAYGRLIRTVLYFALYLTILLMQKDNARLFKVWESLISLTPSSNSNSQPITEGYAMQVNGPADIFTWINSVAFPAWNDPVCGDGQCQAPNEYPALGQLGCQADCGSSAAPTTAVNITLTASYNTNALTTENMQAAFVAATWWNLCFTSDYTGSPSQLCWFDAPQNFTSATSTTSVVLALPDADWQLVVNAPFGNVVGTVTNVGPGVQNPGTLTSWGYCLPNTAGSAAPPVPAALPPPPSPLPPGIKRSPISGVTGRRALTGAAEDADAADAARGARARHRGAGDWLQAFEAELDRRSVRADLDSAFSAGALSSGADEAALISAAHARGGVQRRMGLQVKSLVLDVSNTGVLFTTDTVPGSATVPGSQEYVIAADAATGQRVVFVDWRPYVNYSVAGTNLVQGTPGPDDSYTDNTGAVWGTTGCQAGADFYTVLKVMDNAAGARFVSWTLSSSTSGGNMASSFMSAWWNANTGGQGSGYNPYPAPSYYVERWCAPSAAAMAGALTVTLSTSASATAYNGFSTSPVGVLFMVLSRDRCVQAPQFPLASWPFPAAGGSSTFTQAGGLSAPCTLASPKVLTQSDATTDWSWNVLQVLGTSQGAAFTGLITTDSVLPVAGATLANASCPAGYSPMYFLSWFPASADNVPWYVTLLSRYFAYLSISGTNTLDIGLVPTISSFNTAVKDGVNAINPAAAAATGAAPAGVIQPLCMANGVYKITARQAAEPYRAGQFQFTTPDGCESFAASNGLLLQGLLSESVAGGVSDYFAVGMSEGAAYGNLYSGQCDLQIDTVSAAAGWTNCVANGGSRVQAVWAGAGVYHSSDVSWRVSTPDGTAMGNPTFMWGGGYAPNANAVSQWCLLPGTYYLNAYDNNIVSAANASAGWDGGVLFVTDPNGCIWYEGTVEDAPANAGATINSFQGTFTVGTDGTCVTADARGTLGPVATSAADLGTCPYSYGALTLCTQSPPSVTQAQAAFSAVQPNAQVSTCNAMCASANCQSFAMNLAGPVPPGYGCCNQLSGLAQFNFSLWNYNTPEVDYGLIPPTSDALRARYLANNNQVVLGLLLQTDRWATGNCSLRFSNIVGNTCQLAQFSSDPFGVDPAFVLSSQLYAGVPASNFYRPWELNSNGIPYGFFPDSAGATTFSVFIDVNFGQAAAAAVIQYLQDGNYIDGVTNSVTGTVITYNQLEHVFATLYVNFTFLPSGELIATSQVSMVDLEPYLDTEDFVRAALEIIFCMCVCASVVSSVLAARNAWRAGGRAELRSHLNAEFINNFNLAINYVEILYWLIAVFGYGATLTVVPRYDVYANVNAPARTLALLNGGAGLRSVLNLIKQMQFYNTLIGVYDTLHGVNLIVFIANIVSQGHFQPRLGVITRTLGYSLKDLGHFVSVFCFMFGVCSCTVYLVFGTYIPQFSTLGHAFHITWNMIFFQDSNYMDSFYYLPTPLNYPGVLYYWVFSIFMTIMMLNFATAIIVDSFAAVKAANARTLSVPEELRHLSTKTWFRFAGGEHAKGAAARAAPAPPSMGRRAELMSLAAGAVSIASRRTDRSKLLLSERDAKSVLNKMAGAGRATARQSQGALTLPPGVVARRVLPVQFTDGHERLMDERDLQRLLGPELTRAMRDAGAVGATADEAVNTVIRQLLGAGGVELFFDEQGRRVEQDENGRVLDPSGMLTGMTGIMYQKVGHLEEAVEAQLQTLQAQLLRSNREVLDKVRAVEAATVGGGRGGGTVYTVVARPDTAELMSPSPAGAGATPKVAPEQQRGSGRGADESSSEYLSS